MKALVYEGPRQMILREVNPPEVGRGEVLIEVAFSGICGSELSGFLGQSSIRKPPLIFGHEFSGRIVDAGANTSFPLGARVTANPLISCGVCTYCQAGDSQLCADRRLLGAALAGSNAALVAIPQDNVVLIPDALGFAQATLAEPIAYAVHVVEMLSLAPPDVLVVLGMGPIGLFVLETARHYGIAQVYALDTNRDRLGLAKALGAAAILDPARDNVEAIVREATAGFGAAAVVDAVGSSATRQSAAKLVRRGGTIVFSGLHVQDTSLPLNDMVRNEIVTRGAFAYRANQFRRAVDLLAHGSLGLHDDWIVTAPMGQGAEWYDRLITNPGAIAKVLLIPET